MTFIHTDKGLVSINSIHRIGHPDKSGNCRVFFSDDMEASTHESQRRAIASVVPVQGEWELLTAFYDDEAKAFICFQTPILAWGLTLMGSLDPITVDHPSGVELGGWADTARQMEHMNFRTCRKAGTPTVYGEDEEFTDQASWLKTLKRRYEDKLTEKDDPNRRHNVSA